VRNTGSETFVLPVSGSYDRVSTKLRWGLAADTTEVAALNSAAAGCDGSRVTFTPAL
jgi:hypothetical protein